MSLRIGWIGTGVMGSSMANHLIDNGYKLTVYTRSKIKATHLISKGASWADTPREVATASDVVFSIVGYPNDVEDICLNQKTGILKGLSPGGVFVDMTTSKPSLAKKIAEEAKKNQCHALDAPVSGGDVGAKAGTLSIMVGGEKDVVEKINPLFKCMGKNIRHMGPAGAGQNTKMVNQILISTTMIGLVESLLYASKAGLNLDETIKAVESGAAGSWSLSNYGPRITKHNFDPGFFVEHFIKDMEIALDEAEKMNLKLSGLELALKLYKTLKEMGHGNKGTHALVLAVAKMNNIEF